MSTERKIPSINLNAYRSFRKRVEVANFARDNVEILWHFIILPIKSGLSYSIFYNVFPIIIFYNTCINNSKIYKTIISYFVLEHFFFLFSLKPGSGYNGASYYRRSSFTQRQRDILWFNRSIYRTATVNPLVSKFLNKKTPLCLHLKFYTLLL